MMKRKHGEFNKDGNNGGDNDEISESVDKKIKVSNFDITTSDITISDIIISDITTSDVTTSDVTTSDVKFDKRIDLVVNDDSKANGDDFGFLKKLQVVDKHKNCEGNNTSTKDTDFIGNQKSSSQLSDTNKDEDCVIIKIPTSVALKYYPIIKELIHGCKNDNNKDVTNDVVSSSIPIIKTLVKSFLSGFLGDIENNISTSGSYSSDTTDSSDSTDSTDSTGEKNHEGGDSDINKDGSDSKLSVKGMALDDEKWCRNIYGNA